MELLQQVVDDPASYGITNLWDIALNPNTGIVVPNPDEYLWWDEIYHQTTRHHEIRAQAAYELIISEISADFDGDSDVDGGDFLEWQRGEVTNPPSAEDLAHWETQFGTSSTLSAAASIPEPSTLLLGALAVVGLLVERSSMSASAMKSRGMGRPRG